MLRITWPMIYSEQRKELEARRAQLQQAMGKTPAGPEREAVRAQWEEACRQLDGLTRREEQQAGIRRHSNF